MEHRETFHTFSPYRPFNSANITIVASPKPAKMQFCTFYNCHESSTRLALAAKII